MHTKTSPSLRFEVSTKHRKPQDSNYPSSLKTELHSYDSHYMTTQRLNSIVCICLRHEYIGHTYIYIYICSYTHLYIYRRISFASNFKPRTPNTQPASAMPRKRSTRSSKGKGRPISISKVWLKASSLNGLAERVFFAFCLLLFFFKWALFHLQLRPKPRLRGSR